MRIKVKHVNRIRSRGKTYFYHRVTGERLPDDPAQAATRANEINASMAGRRTTRPDTLAALVASYKASADFKGLRETTRGDYARYLEKLAAINYRVADIDRAFVAELRDAFADTPRTANYMLAILRRLLSFAVERGWRTDNPAARFRRLKEGPGHRAWADEEIAKFLAGAPVQLADAVRVGLYTGQRQGDCFRMTLAHVDGEFISVAQSKTGARVDIPIHPELWSVIERAKADERMLLLATPTGRPWNRHTFGNELRPVLAELGMVGLTFHGLRHTAAVKLSEAGCSARELMAILGHRTAQMAMKYASQADQKRLATAAISKLLANKLQNTPAKTAKHFRNGGVK